MIFEFCVIIICILAYCLFTVVLFKPFFSSQIQNTLPIKIRLISPGYSSFLIKLVFYHYHYVLNNQVLLKVSDNLHIKVLAGALTYFCLCLVDKRNQN